MSTNGQFREDELVSRKVKVGNEWQTKNYPVVGGRLRILHESNDRLSIRTEIVKLDSDFVVVKATIENQRGTFTGTGTASVQRDARLADSLVELAETRAIARALRFGGIGVEYTGAEEVSHVVPEPDKERKPGKNVFIAEEHDGNSEKQGIRKTDNPMEIENVQQSSNTNRATQAQCRALYALTKKAHYSEQDIESLLSPLNASTFQELTRESASKLISYLQTEVAA